MRRADVTKRLEPREIALRHRGGLVDSLAPQLRTIPPSALRRIRLDNAALLAHRLYNTDLDLFDTVWVKENGDLRTTIQRIIKLAKSNPKHPFDALRRWVAAARAGS